MKTRRTLLLVLMIFGAALCFAVSGMAYLRGEESIHAYKPIMLGVAFLFGAVVFSIRRKSEY